MNHAGYTHGRKNTRLRMTSADLWIWMQARKMSTRKLARILELPRSALSNWALGQHQPPYYLELALAELERRGRLPMGSVIPAGGDLATSKWYEQLVMPSKRPPSLPNHHRSVLIPDRRFGSRSRKRYLPEHLGTP